MRAGIFICFVHLTQYQAHGRCQGWYTEDPIQMLWSGTMVQPCQGTQYLLTICFLIWNIAAFTNALICLWIFIFCLFCFYGFNLLLWFHYTVSSYWMLHRKTMVWFYIKKKKKSSISSKSVRIPLSTSNRICFSARALKTVLVNSITLVKTLLWKLFLKEILQVN